MDKSRFNDLFDKFETRQVEVIGQSSSPAGVAVHQLHSYDLGTSIYQAVEHDEFGTVVWTGRVFVHLINAGDEALHRAIKVAYEKNGAQTDETDVELELA